MQVAVTEGVATAAATLLGAVTWATPLSIDTFRHPAPAAAVATATREAAMGGKRAKHDGVRGSDNTHTIDQQGERGANGRWRANKPKRAEDDTDEQQQGAGGQLGAAATGEASDRSDGSARIIAAASGDEVTAVNIAQVERAMSTAQRARLTAFRQVLMEIGWHGGTGESVQSRVQVAKLLITARFNVEDATNEWATTHDESRAPRQEKRTPKRRVYERTVEDVDAIEEAELRRLERGSGTAGTEDDVEYLSDDVEVVFPAAQRARREQGSARDMLVRTGHVVSDVPGDGACLYWSCMACMEEGDARTLKRMAERGATPLDDEGSMWGAAGLAAKASQWRRRAVAWWLQNTEVRKLQRRSCLEFCPCWPEWVFDAVAQVTGEVRRAVLAEAGIGEREELYSEEQAGRIATAADRLRQQRTGSHYEALATKVSWARWEAGEVGEESSAGRRYVEGWVTRHEESRRWAGLAQIQGMAGATGRRIVLINEGLRGSAVREATPDGRERSRDWLERCASCAKVGCWQACAAGGTGAGTPPIVVLYNGHNHFRAVTGQGGSGVQVVN